jgi:hypothetical protein
MLLDLEWVKRHVICSRVQEEFSWGYPFPSGQRRTRISSSILNEFVTSKLITSGMEV